MDWEANDRICGNRWKTLAKLVKSMERHGRLKLHHEVRYRLFSASASTLVRLLRPVRATVGPGGREAGDTPGDAKFQFAFTTNGNAPHRASWKSTW